MGCQPSCGVQSVAERLAGRWEAAEVSVPTVQPQPTATPAGKVQ